MRLEAETTQPRATTTKSSKAAMPAMVTSGVRRLGATDFRKLMVILWLNRVVGASGLRVARHGEQPDGKTRQRRSGEKSADARRDMQRKALNSVAKRGHFENPKPQLRTLMNEQVA